MMQIIMATAVVFRKVYIATGNEKVSVPNKSNVYGDENSNYQSNTSRRSKGKNTEKEYLLPPKEQIIPEKEKQKRRQSFSFNKQKSEMKQAIIEANKEESKKIAGKYMETGSAEKLKEIQQLKTIPESI